MRFKHRFQVVSVNERPAKGDYAASTWVNLADGAGEPFEFQVEDVRNIPEVFTLIEGDVEIVGRTFGAKRSTRFIFHGYTPIPSAAAAAKAA